MAALHKGNLEQPALLTIGEACEYLNVSQRTLYRWLRAGRIRRFRVGNVTRIARAELEEFVRRHTLGGSGDGEAEHR